MSGDNSDGKVHVANMGPIWGRQDPGGSHVGHMNFAIWEWLLHWLWKDMRTCFNLTL